MLSSWQNLSRPSIRSALLQLNEDFVWAKRNIPQMESMQAREGTKNEDHFANNQQTSLLSIISALEMWKGLQKHQTWHCISRNQLNHSPSPFSTHSSTASFQDSLLSKTNYAFLDCFSFHVYTTAIHHFIAAWQAPRKPPSTCNCAIGNDVILLEAWSTFDSRYLAHFIM